MRTGLSWMALKEVSHATHADIVTRQVYLTRDYVVRKKLCPRACSLPGLLAVGVHWRTFRHEQRRTTHAVPSPDNPSSLALSEAQCRPAASVTTTENQNG